MMQVGVARVVVVPVPAYADELATPEAATTSRRMTTTDAGTFTASRGGSRGALDSTAPTMGR